MMINGSALKAAREKAGLTQVCLAQGICTSAMICKIEKGKASPSEKLVAALTSKLCISVEDLLKNE